MVAEYHSGMFIFFFSPLGIIGSIIISVAVTLVLKAIFFH